VSAEDENLVQSAMAGDLDSFGKLAERYYPAMVGIAYAVCRDHDAAEDAAQEALARAMVSLPRLRRPDRFGPWLCRICRNVARDMLHGAAHKPRQESTIAVDPETHHQVSRAVNEALNRLSKASRELVVLKYYGNLSYEQMSQTLHLSKGAINGRLTRAKRKMACYLRRNGLAELKS
jgi:RNA polymerase sigma-70 factor, ECF subfamily